VKFAMYSGLHEKILEVGIRRTAEYAVHLGFEAVEVFESVYAKGRDAIPDVATARCANRIWKAYDLPVVCYSVETDLWRSKENEDKLRKQVEIAAELESPYFHHTLFPRSCTAADSPKYDIVRNEVLEAATRIAEYAAKYHITCIYEEQGGYFNGVEGFGEFYNEIRKRCKNVGVCGDLGNILFVNETPEKFLEVYAKDVRHVHVKDYLWKKEPLSPGRYWNRAKEDCWLRDTMVGSGVVDFEACIKLLKESGYQGYYALENVHPEPYEAGVYQAMEYLKRFDG